MQPLTPPPGEQSLSHLLSSLHVSLHPSTFVFVTLPPNTQPPPTLFPQMTFRESEGLTVITTLDSAKDHPTIIPTFPCRMITCEVHSSLEAVGFLAVIANVLKEKNMGVNPVAGFFHDHLFVPLGCEEEAMSALRELAVKNGGHPIL